MPLGQWIRTGVAYGVDKFEIVPDNEPAELFDVIEFALALAGYEVLDGDKDAFFIRHAPTDKDFPITLREIHLSPPS